MPRYVYDRETGEMVEVVVDAPRPSAFPAIHRDTPAYYSMASRKMVDGRVARREDMKRTGSREVDPSEKPPKPVEPGYVSEWRQGKGIKRGSPQTEDLR